MDPLTQFLIAIAAMAVSYAITSSSMPKTEPRKPAALEDFSLPQVDEGTAQAVIFGDCWTGDWQVLWYGNYRSEPITGKGKKG